MTQEQKAMRALEVLHKMGHDVALSDEGRKVSIKVWLEDMSDSTWLHVGQDEIDWYSRHYEVYVHPVSYKS